MNYQFDRTVSEKEGYPCKFIGWSYPHSMPVHVLGAIHPPSQFSWPVSVFSIWRFWASRAVKFWRSVKKMDLRMSDEMRIVSSWEFTLLVANGYGTNHWNHKLHEIIAFRQTFGLNNISPIIISGPGVGYDCIEKSVKLRVSVIILLIIFSYN